MVQAGTRPQAPAPHDEHTERAEQLTITRWAHAAIMAITSGGVISSCNSAGAELYRCAPRDIIGRPADILVPPERRPYEAALIQQVLDGDVIQDYLTDRLRCDGTTVAVSVAISRLVDSAGAIRGTVTIARRVSLKATPPTGRTAIQATRASPSTPGGRTPTGPNARKPSNRTR
ncbi:PAS domain-containing protein [Actinoplanes sp. ATCC 53533]|uniref:PAS domain-containing protein n=1 Tax=Actinoplanes sp. ATCC 53533 TaxID=1288362 RepID=UPI0013159FF9|nr:PAS domain-containing protein [Actinoplanes sp. ATCC 53533]